MAVFSCLVSGRRLCSCVSTFLVTEAQQEEATFDYSYKITYVFDFVADFMRNILVDQNEHYSLKMSNLLGKIFTMTSHDWKVC